MSDLLKLGRFGHHPDPAIDFEIEVEEIQCIHADEKVGFRTDPDLDRRIAKAMQFRVGGTVEASVAKALLREVETARASMSHGEKQ